MIYLWCKAFHLICVVVWFAGLFYIFRLYVYHVMHKDNKAMAAAYSVMERKLLYMITHPALFLAAAFGIVMIYYRPELLTAGWFRTKLVVVAGLIAYQTFAGRVYKRFAKGDYFLSEKACRIINEVPTVLLIAGVLLAVLKPF